MEKQAGAETAEGGSGADLEGTRRVTGVTNSASERISTNDRNGVTDFWRYSPSHQDSIVNAKGISRQLLAGLAQDSTGARNDVQLGNQRLD